MKNIIFLDIDGVLNCEIFYKEDITTVKKSLRKKVKSKQISREEYYKSQLCPTRILWINDLCKETDSEIVISSTWRLGKAIDELQKILNDSGATFKIIDATPHTGERETEISLWLKDNCEKYDQYVIIDDCDIFLTQVPHFFQTDSYSGLTPEICKRIKIFLTHKTF